jgi:hypothetical protein
VQWLCQQGFLEEAAAKSCPEADQPEAVPPHQPEANCCQVCQELTGKSADHGQDVPVYHLHPNQDQSEVQRRPEVVATYAEAGEDDCQDVPARSDHHQEDLDQGIHLHQHRNQDQSDDHQNLEDDRGVRLRHPNPEDDQAARGDQDVQEDLDRDDQAHQFQEVHLHQSRNQDQQGDPNGHERDEPATNQKL